MSVPFRAFRRFNDPALGQHAGLKTRLDGRALPALVRERERPTVIDRLITELANASALPVKELFESFEFFERVRRRLRAKVVADLCCGHGLTGLLFVIFSRPVDRVILVDHRRPPSYERVYQAALSAAPWIEGRVEYLETSLALAAPKLPEGCSVVAIHACGQRTDRCLDIAIERRGALAVMPCCYFGTGNGAPRALTASLGADLASDIDRTYRLRDAGYRVEWTAIPPAITEKNRILVARPADAGILPRSA